jgi:signal peptidase I
MRRPQTWTRANYAVNRIHGPFRPKVMLFFHAYADLQYNVYGYKTERVRQEPICVIVVHEVQQEPSIPFTPYSANEPEVVVGDKKGAGWHSILSTLGILIAAPVVALLLTAFVFQSYEVEGPSMETTLQNQDRLLVLKVPRTWARITGHDYVPKRGEVVIFVKRGLAQLGSASDKQLIKRVIGLPGDRVVVSNGHYTIYNRDHPDGFNPDLGHDFSSHIAAFTKGKIDVFVPEGQVFVSGDNRGNSYDSRDFGTVSTDDLVGRLIVRIFPLNKFDSFI